MKLVERLAAPTPPFFQKVRTIGLLLTTGSLAILKLPELPALPAIIAELATHAAVAGIVMSGVSQAAVSTDNSVNTAT